MVKVDSADFDIKLQETYSVLNLQKIHIPAETSLFLFSFIYNVKKLHFYVLCNDITFKIRPRHHPTTRPFCSLLLLFHSAQICEKSQRPVACCLAQC
jgi:hypothetical protein